MASRSGTAVFSLTLSAVAPCLDGVPVAMAVASVDEAIPRAPLLVLLALVGLVLLLVQEASAAAAASVDEDLAAIVVAAFVVTVASAGAASEADEVVIEEVMEAVVAASAINRTDMALPTAPHPVLAVGSVAAVEAVSIEAVPIEAAAAAAALATIDAVVGDSGAEVVETEDQAARTMSPSGAETGTATAEIATVGMAGAETTMARGSVGTRATATTTRDSDRGGTKLRQQLGTLIWVCQKVTFPSSALFV